MFRKLFDFIIIDSPPVLAVTDPLSIAGKSDGIIFVIDSGVTKLSDALDAREELDALGKPILGVVLNKVTYTKAYYRYLYYYYESREGERKKSRKND